MSWKTSQDWNTRTILNWIWWPKAPIGPYGYVHIIDGTLRYVGISASDQNRGVSHARTKEHRRAMISCSFMEIRFYPLDTLKDAKEWEQYTIDKALFEEGWPLFNRALLPTHVQGQIFMALNLPKTYKTFWKKYKGVKKKKGPLK